MTLSSLWSPLYPDVQVPNYTHKGDAAQDLRLHVSPLKLEREAYYKKIYSDEMSYDKFIKSCREGQVTLQPGEWFAMPTGVAVNIPAGVALLICPRSGLATKGFTINNAPGIVDSSYKYVDDKNMSEIFVILKNESQTARTFSSGDRIAQGLFINYLSMGDENSSNSERVGGLGSSGLN